MDNQNQQKLDREIQPSQKSIKLQTLTLEQLNGISGGGGGTLIPIKIKHNV